VNESAGIITQKLYRLDISYIGTSYYGFQSQPHGNTVQDFLEKALATFCKHPVRVTAASRTDTGVHAEHQVVTFKAAAGLDHYRMLKALNALLPDSIRVVSVCYPEFDFHPMTSSTGKVYRYRIWRSPGESPFVMPFVWVLTTPLDIAAMRVAANGLIGVHDFTSFCAADSSAASKVRRVRDIQILECGPMLEFWFIGDGFLKQMIRNIVGTLVNVGKGVYPPDEVARILAAKSRLAAGMTVPGQGLALVRILFGDDTNLGTLLEASRTGYNVALPKDRFWPD
jgi:tRNA pseudouridine38-40 synthase